MTQGGGVTFLLVLLEKGAKMIEETKKRLLKEQLLKEYKIKSENKETMDVIKELAETMLAFYSKIREKNRVIDNKNLIFEASMLQNRCTMLRGKLASFGLVEAKERERAYV